MTQNIRLSPENRQKLRVAIRNHPGYTSDKPVGALTKEELLAEAERLQIDLKALFGEMPVAEPSQHTAPVPKVGRSPDQRADIVGMAATTEPVNPEEIRESVEEEMSPEALAEKKADKAFALSFPALRTELVRLYRHEATQPKVIEKVVEVERRVEVPVAVPHAVEGNVLSFPGAPRAETSAVVVAGAGIVLPKPTKREKASKVFGVRGLKNPDGSQIMVDVWDDATAPAVDPLYRWPVEALKLALVCINRNQPIPFWMAGPPGTGKTAFARQLAARLGRAFVRINFDSTAERYEWFGGERVRNGSTVWQDGALLQGLRRPGCIVLLDELGFAKPEHLAALHALLERNGCITVQETGEVVRPAPGVALMAADNSNGTGDRSGMFAGVRDQNRALLSRFAFVLYFDYLPADEEAALLHEMTEKRLPLPVAEHLVQFLGKCRTKAAGGELEIAPGLRELQSWADALVSGVPVRDAFTAAIANKYSEAGAEELQLTYKASVDEGFVAKTMKGEPAAADRAAEQQAAKSNDPLF